MNEIKFLEASTAKSEEQRSTQQKWNDVKTGTGFYGKEHIEREREASRKRNGERKKATYDDDFA